MAQLSPRELDVLLRVAQWHGRLVHADLTDDEACAAYDADVVVVQRLAAYGLLSRPLVAPYHGGPGSYRACLAPVTPRGLDVLRQVAEGRSPC